MGSGIAEQIKPMPFWQSLVFFGIPALLGVLGHYFLSPFFLVVGASEENAYYFQALVVFVFLLIASVVAYVVEGNSLDLSSFRRRFRLFGMGRREWKWTFGGLATQALLSVLATVLAPELFGLLDFDPPVIYPSGPITNSPLMAFVLFMNIVCEEFWWRGYILPRQELQHGRFTWVVHGILWAFFHAFKWWSVPFMLLTTWIIPFVAQRLKNTAPGIIIHLIINSLGIIIELAGLLGMQ
jgi:membrane protease YdiL (CAAX protease family)